MSTQVTDYPQFVASLCKSGEKIIQDLSPSRAHLLHMAVGVSGEAGELLDVVKKSAIYDKPLDVAHLAEELGDIEFFLQGIYNELHLSREQVLLANIEKLSARYPQGTFTNSDAQARADKS